MKYLLAMILLITLPIAADPPVVNRDNVQSFFDAAFAVQTKDHQIAGAVVSVVYQGEVLYQAGYGFADIEHRIPANPDESLFRIASITKPFVWTAIMQLHEQGRLDVNDDVNDYLEAFKLPDTFPEPVRIRHLLTHTPGFEDQAIGMNARTIEEAKSLENYLSNNIPRRVRPAGIHAAYSNWGTALAGYIIEQITGQPWDDYVDDHILTPLDMTSTNTHLVLKEAFTDRLAKSYNYSSGQFVARPYEAMNDTPAGVMSMTAADMSHFMIMHLANGQYKGRQLLKPATARLMQSPLFEAHHLLPAMLHGFYRSDRNGEVIFGHGGDTNQFHSNLSLLPEHDLGLFVSFNADSADEARSNIVRAFIDHFFPANYLRQAPMAANILLDDYEGEYIPLRSNHSSIERLGTLVNGIEISVADQALNVGGNSLWVALAENEFTAKYVDRQMIFKRSESGAVTHVVIGSPLGSYERVSGLNAPGNQKLALGLMLTIAIFTVLGYGFRLLVPSRFVGLDSAPVITAWVHGLLIVLSYSVLVTVLAGNIQEFVLGVPIAMHRMLWVMNLNLILGFFVLWFGIRNWIQGTGTTQMRIHYTMAGLMAVINLWICWYFNILTYPFSGLPVISG
jgi:CubicO group peptidase (beta-lactamase class C family)